MQRSLTALTLLLVSGNALAAAEPVPPQDIHKAVARALPLIVKGNAGHLEKRTCFACHHQAVPVLALVTARSRGLTVDDEPLVKNMKAIATFLGKNRENYLKGQGQGGQIDTAG